MRGIAPSRRWSDLLISFLMCLTNRSAPAGWRNALLYVSCFSLKSAGKSSPGLWKRFAPTTRISHPNFFPQRLQHAYFVIQPIHSFCLIIVFLDYIALVIMPTSQAEATRLLHCDRVLSLLVSEEALRSFLREVFKNLISFYN
jgi:hypothetical protein